MVKRINVGEPLNIDLDDWELMYSSLNTIGKRNRLFVADAGAVEKIIDELVPALRIRKEVVATVLKLEFGYPDRKSYSSAATRDDGSTLYRGITQASKPFWQDVIEHAARKGFKIAARTPESATLFEQIAAPFIYLDRYRGSVETHLFTPAMIYALHQQGPGAARNGFSKVEGKQSGRSLQVIKVAQVGAKGKTKDLWV